MAGCFLSILDFLLLSFLWGTWLQYNTEAQQGKEITFDGRFCFILFCFYQKCVIRSTRSHFPKANHQNLPFPKTVLIFIDYVRLILLVASLSIYVTKILTGFDKLLGLEN